MEILETKLEDVLIFKPEIYRDFRGLNMELYNHKRYTNAIHERLNKKINFVLDKVAVSSKNVLRGIHGDLKTWKLVSCLKGKIYFVVVNCNEESQDFGEWESFDLSDTNRNQVLVPPKYGNAHLVLSDEAIFHYKWSKYYTPKQFSYKWNDPKFNISWPIKNPILSKRDSQSE
mgnify:FL=1